MPSRQALALRRKSLDTLNAMAPPPLVVVYDEARHQYVLSWRDGRADIFHGRYEVVAAYLAGFVRGLRTSPPAY